MARILRPYGMRKNQNISPLDPIWLTEQAIQALKTGRLDEASQYLHAAKSQLKDNINSGDKYPLRRMKTNDISKH